MHRPTCPPTPPNPPEVEALFPEGSVPEDRSGKLSSLCSIANTPLLVQGVVRQILLQHFIDAARFVSNATLRERFVREGGWLPTPDSGLMIEAVEKWDPANTEKRPALLISIDDFRVVKLGIGNRAGADDLTGRVVYEIQWDGTLTIFGICNESAEARLLACEAADVLLGFSQVICDQFNLKQFDLQGLGKAFLVKESNSDFAVPLNFRVVYHSRWSITPEAPRLKTLSIDAGSLPC